MCDKYKKAIPNFKGWRAKSRKKSGLRGRKCGLAVLFLHNSDEVFAFEVVPVFHAEARVDRLFRENLDGEHLVASFEAALEGEVHGFRVVVAEDDVLGLDALGVLLLLLAQLDIAVLFAILGDGVAPEFATATRFLADFELDALLFLVFR